jgi:hypothetical protein
MSVPHSPRTPASALTAKSNAESNRRDFVPRPELCRKNRKGLVLGYGKIPGFGLTLREIEEALALPHE